MAQMLTVGKFKPPSLGNPMTGVGQQYAWGGGYQPQKQAAPKPPGTPGQQYGGNYMYPPIPSGYTTAGDIGGQSVDPETGIAVPAPTQGGAFGGGGGEPDYSSMIGSSWEVAAAEAMMASQMAQARQSFQTDLRQGFIDLGYDQPVTGEGIGDFSKYIDKATMQKAIDNKYSSYAQIKQQQTKANALNSAMLASSGLGTSGTVTETAADTLGQVEQAKYEGLRNFLGQGRSGLTQLGSLQNQLAQGVLNARFAAAQRLAAMYGGGSGGGSGGYTGGGGYTQAGDVNYGFEMPGGGGISNLDYVTQSEDAINALNLPPPSQFGAPTVRPPSSSGGSYWDTHRPADRQ